MEYKILVKKKLLKLEVPIQSKSHILIKENFYKREILSLVLLVRLPTKLLPLWTLPLLAKVLLEFILNPLNILKAIHFRSL
jgi:hypothetical protein